MEKPLHAFPDHIVMQEILDGVAERRHSVEEALAKIKADPNWMPVGIDPERLLIFFANVGRRKFTRWQFVYSIADMAASSPALPSFSAPLDLLGKLNAADG